MSHGHVTFINGVTRDLTEHEDVVALLDHPAVAELSWTPGPPVTIVYGDHAA